MKRARTGIGIGAVKAAVTAWSGTEHGIARAQSAPTFARDVAPIFYSRCVECHRPTMFAPMSLVTFDEARPWARSIRQRVAARPMPPWGAGPAHRVFKNNSPANKFNPDPTRDVRWVDQTWEEMMIGFWGTVVERPVTPSQKNE